MEFGEIRYGAHRTENPLIHKITNKSATEMFCIDAEVLNSPPVVSPIPLVAEHHELIKTRDKIRVYKLYLEADESTIINYPFFYLEVVIRGSPIRIELVADTLDEGRKHSAAPKMSWLESTQLGDVSWKEPCMSRKQTNVGSSPYEAYICEWR